MILQKLSFFRKYSCPRVEPGAAGWEARMLPLCSSRWMIVVRRLFDQMSIEILIRLKFRHRSTSWGHTSSVPAMKVSIFDFFGIGGIGGAGEILLKLAACPGNGSDRVSDNFSCQSCAPPRRKFWTKTEFLRHSSEINFRYEINFL